MKGDYVNLIEEQIDSIFDNGTFDEEAGKEEVGNDTIIAFYFHRDRIIELITTYWELKMTRYMISLEWIEDQDKFANTVRAKMNETHHQLDKLMSCILDNLKSIVA